MRIQKPHFSGMCMLAHMVWVGGDSKRKLETCMACSKFLHHIIFTTHNYVTSTDDETKSIEAWGGAQSSILPFPRDCQIAKNLSSFINLQCTLHSCAVCQPLGGQDGSCAPWAIGLWIGIYVNHIPRVTHVMSTIKKGDVNQGDSHSPNRQSSMKTTELLLWCQPSM